LSPLQKLRAEILDNTTQPRAIAEQFLASANQNVGRNVYISRDENWTLREADRIRKEFTAAEFSSDDKPPLFGLPISMKDCFDLEGLHGERPI